MAEEDKSELAAIRLRKGRTIVLSILSTLALLAKLTLDLPPAADKCLGWLKPVPEYVYDIVLVLSLFTALFLLFRGLRAQRSLADKLEEERAARQRLEADLVEVDIEPEPEPIAPPDCIGRVREAYPYCADDLKMARLFLIGICRRAFRDGGGDKGLVARAVKDIVVARCAHEEAILNQEMEKLVPGVSLAQFDATLRKFHDVMLCNCGVLFTWIREAGQSILGDDLYRSDSYARLRQQHERTLEELRRMSGRPGLEKIRELIFNLEELAPRLPTPPVDPPPSTASGQAPPSSPESSG